VLIINSREAFKAKQSSAWAERADREDRGG
jgi:hypothetical protein